MLFYQHGNYSFAFKLVIVVLACVSINLSELLAIDSLMRIDVKVLQRLKLILAFFDLIFGNDLRLCLNLGFLVCIFIQQLSSTTFDLCLKRAHLSCQLAALACCESFQERPHASMSEAYHGYFSA